jgi:uncharacterized protein YjdB
VATVPGLRLYSGNVRWCSQNKKVATVSKNGTVKLRKKGTTYVYAKAHNGVNSRKIKVTVK